MGTSEPLDELIWYADISRLPELPTYKNLPVGSAMMELGFVPATKGEPAMAVRAPVVALMLKAETVPPSFAEYKNWFRTVTNAAGPLVAEVEPVETADCALVSAPVVELMVNVLML